MSHVPLETCSLMWVMFRKHKYTGHVEDSRDDEVGREDRTNFGVILEILEITWSSQWRFITVDKARVQGYT